MANRPYVRNAANTAFVDVFCKSGWKIKNTDGSWITLSPANTRIRNANNTDWLTPVCPVPVVYPPSGTLLTVFCSGFNKYGNYANGSGGSTSTLIAANSPDCGYIASAGPVGWKINWGNAQPGDNGRYALQQLIAELIPNGQKYIIDEGPNKNGLTAYRWKGTTIAYDPFYHPLCQAVYPSGGGWAGYGAPATYAVFEDSARVGHVYSLTTSGVGTRLVASHSVPNLTQAPVWYTRYYDRGGGGPGTVS